MKNFNEIYKKIYYDLKNSNLNSKRKKSLESSKINFIIVLIINIVIVLIFYLLFFRKFQKVYDTPFVTDSFASSTSSPFEKIIFNPSLWLVLLLMSGASVVLFQKKAIFKTLNKSYIDLYKNTVISRLVKYYDEGLTFNQQKHLNEEDYREGNFEEFNIFRSEDYISGNLAGKYPIQMSDITVQTRSTDGESDSSAYKTTFQGLFGVCNLKKSTNCTLEVRNDKGKKIEKEHKENQVILDSHKFEDFFDVYSSDKIKTYRLLTSDIMEHLVSFKRNNNSNFDFTIKKDKVYIRIFCEDLFDGVLSKESLDYEVLLTYFTYLDFMCNLSLMISNVIDEKDI